MERDRGCYFYDQLVLKLAKLEDKNEEVLDVEKWDKKLYVYEDSHDDFHEGGHANDHYLKSYDYNYYDAIDRYYYMF